jgi:hypothetical protein
MSNDYCWSSFQATMKMLTKAVICLFSLLPSSQWSVELLIVCLLPNSGIAQLCDETMTSSTSKGKLLVCGEWS